MGGEALTTDSSSSRRTEMVLPYSGVSNEDFFHEIYIAKAQAQRHDVNPQEPRHDYILLHKQNTSTTAPTSINRHEIHFINGSFKSIQVCPYELKPPKLFVHAYNNALKGNLENSYQQQTQ